MVLVSSEGLQDGPRGFEAAQTPECREG
jgi:hypothetical protein